MTKLSFRSRTIIAAGTLYLTWAISQAQTVTTLVTLNGINGTDLRAPLVQGTDGNLYGTSNGGKYKGTYYPGTVFKVTLDGVLTTLTNLKAHPIAGLVQAINGNFYGAVQDGGYFGAGTIFAMTPAGQLKTLYQSCANLPNCPPGGIEPVAGLIQAVDGNLYGTFLSGGPGDGTVFQMTPKGILTTLHVFTLLDGNEPWSGVIQATDGNFYGTTIYGGPPCPGYVGNTGCGTVFKMTPNGTLTTLHNFCAQVNCPDGLSPYAGVIQANDGNLYGLTSQGGGANCVPGGCGTAFKITLGGSFTLLNTFGLMGANNPQASLVQATDGNFYGTGFGGLFRMTPTGTVTVLYLFAHDSSVASLIQGTDGNFYGTTVGAGTAQHVYNAGTVFRLSVGLGPFVKIQPTAGKVGSAVTILGTNLAGVTRVTFNGTPAASFTVNSTNSAISTTVPSGATTGTVQVTLPSGSALSSNVPFRVAQ